MNVTKVISLISQIIGKREKSCFLFYQDSYDREEYYLTAMIQKLFCLTITLVITLTFVMSVCDVSADLTEPDCRFCHDDPDILGPTSNVDRHHLNVNTPTPVGDCLETSNVCQVNSDCYDFCDITSTQQCAADADCPIDPTTGTNEPCIVGDNYCIGDSQAPNAILMSPASGLYECLTCHTLVWNPVTQTNEFAPFRDCMLCHLQSENQHPVADPNGPYLCAAGVPCSLDGTGSFDPNNDPLTYEWDCGDSTPPETGATTTHIYNDAGIYDICLIVEDTGVLSNTACTSAIIYDPSAGFVTGGGWIDSPAGAYAPDSSLTGEADFGFVSKYKKGATVPTGQTAFQFQTADLNFYSDSYDWLIVTGGKYAMFKGSGTINGMGDYRFMLWAGDIDPDTFRIKIWEEDSFSIETLIYDNGFYQAIGGGSIVIHTKQSKNE